MIVAKRNCKVAVVQLGPESPDKRENVKNNLSMIDSVKEKVDFVLFPEMSTTQYWVTGKFNKMHFEDAESVDGPAVKMFAKKAKQISSFILLPFFEKGEIEGEYFNSVVLLSPEGKVVEGRLPNGEKVLTYRKNHLSKEHLKDLKLDEINYMRAGKGFPIFQTEFGKIGILICRDRWFPESWRTLGLLGAEMILIATASTIGLQDLFVHSMRTWTREHQVFGIIANKVGREKVDKRTVNYCGLSCVVGPDGKVIKCASDKPEVLTASIDLSEVARVRQLLPNYRDRRPELYTEITKSR
jgi:N-carbamoylputrescine amidase